MGWIKDARDWVVDWIEDHIIKPLVDWIVDVIEEIRVNLRNFMHTLKEWLAKWLEYDWFFLLFTSLLIASIFLLPSIIEMIGSSAAFKAITTWVKLLTDKLVALIDIKSYIDIHLVDRLLKTFWEEYRDVRAVMTNAISGLAADLGEGTGFIHALVESGRGVYLGTAAVLGVDPRLAETEWYEDTSTFVKKVNDRFYHYAKDPGAIYSDFFNEVLLPRAVEQQTVNQEQLGQIRENYNRTNQIEQGLTQIEQSVDLFIATMPASIEEQFNRRWDDIRPTIEDLLEVLRDDLIPFFQEIKEAFEEHVSYQVAINKEVERKLASTSGLLRSFYMLPETEQADTRQIVEDILLDEWEDQQKAEQETDDSWQRRLAALLDNKIEPFRPSPALAYEDRPSIGGRPRLHVNIPSPFIGNY